MRAERAAGRPGATGGLPARVCFRARHGRASRPSHPLGKAKPLWAAAFLLALAGCGSTPGGGRGVEGASRVDHVELMALPTAVNINDTPGADGLQVRVYLFQLSQPQAVLLGRGNLDFLLFEGHVGRAEVPRTRPIQIW